MRNEGKVIRLAVIAPNFPEYSVEYSRGMARFCDTLVCVDVNEMRSEYSGRKVPQTQGQLTIAPIKFKSILDLGRLASILVRFRPTVVNLQEGGGVRKGVFLAVCYFLLRGRVRTVVTVHDPLPHEGRDEEVARRASVPWYYLRRVADVIVVHGSHCAAVYRTKFLRQKQMLLVSDHGLILEPNSIKEPEFEKLKLLFFGRMEYYKGVEILLRAAETLHEEQVPFELVIAGRGPELDKWEQAFKRLPEVRVYNGFVESASVIELIQDTECVVLPYLSASQSGVLAAAFAGRRYVIASKTGGLVDVVEHMANGILVPAGDAQALVDSIRQLAVNRKLRTSLYRGAQATAETKLDWSNIASRVATALQQC